MPAPDPPMFRYWEPPLAEISSYGELIAFIRDRKAQLELSNEDVEAIGGLPDRYVNKLLSPRPSKTLGRTSFGVVAGALAFKLIAVVDHEAMARLQRRRSRARGGY
jgi:hypothetical protein